MATKSAILVILLLVTCARCQQFASTKAGPQMLCPQLYQKVFKGYIPRGNTSAGTYQEMPDVKTQQECVYSCCIKEDCNVVFMTDNKCYHVICASNELCMPTQILHDETHVSMVLVRPTPGEDSWGDVIINQDLDAMEGYSIGRETGYFGVKHPERYEDLYKDILQMQGTSVDYNTACNVGIPSTCPPDEECVQNREKSRAGTCKCKSGFLRRDDGVCKLSLAGISESAINGGVENSMSGAIDANTTTPVTKKVIIVKAASKQVKLPDSEVSLQAEVSPPPDEGEQYNYEWTSLHKPDGSNAVKHQNAEVMQLTKLSEGLYTFKVNVSNEHAYGETFVNVTVLPASRINKPPQIVITPANQTIKLPNTGTVLDASSSTDDDAITSYHWELQQGPIGYQPQLVDAPTLQLNDLSRPGNYTFKLTVTDSDKATSVSTANVTVLKFTDYPPEANAGQDTIIYLPHNQITLNGNLSTDDHTITTWEWTKSPDDADKAVDMQNTRTPYLHLSNLEEGMYTFQLKVTDSANQTGTASVLVFVKPPTNKPPVARAGENITMSLPQTWTMVDATNSSDDNKIVLFKWEKLEGPSNVVFANPNASRTNVTGLTKGSYVLKVSVTDDSNNVASALQYITVNQNKNQKPVANAGGDFEVELPRNAIYINGSKSSDDWAIVKWKWTRSDASLAFGRIAEKSDETPILILTDMVPGRYIFNLSVADEQGLSDTNAVTVVVKNDQRMYYLVDMTVYADVRKISHGQYETLKGKLALLVQDNTKLKVRELKPQPGAEKAIIRFYVEDANGKALNANDVVHHLRSKLKVDASLLGFSVASLQTAICQNNCSGHGVCEEASRKCICEAFWMSDMFKVYFGSAQDSDCSWSILYVVLGVVCGVVAFTGSVWGAIYLCMSRCSCRNARKPSTYKLIEDTEDLPPYYPRKDISDTDSDSDVVFETRNKNGRFGDSRNGHKPSRNGMPKMGRRIKT